LPSALRGPLGHLALAPDFARTGPGQPVVTVGIPAYNRPELLRQTLASLAAQRDGPAFEVIVCDDGALPATREIVESSALPCLRYYLNRPALGAVGNWNRCLALATAPWVTILHEDDALYPWFFATVAPHLRPALSGVAVRCIQATAPPLIPPPARRAPPRRYAPVWFLKSSMTPFPGVVFPRELGLRLGGFDPRQGSLADYAFWYDLAAAGRIETLPTTAAFYRISEGQWTDREWPTMLRRAHLLRLRIAREQLPHSLRLGRWLARFYTGRMARSYARRFPAKPATLTRALRFQRIPFAWLPSGWVWKFLQRY
jgi:glycosyltransferase involved in cell wall biosynthesis